MDSENRPLHIFLFPFMAHGHGIPTVDMAKLFASKGVKSTIITTPLNAPFFSTAIAKSKIHFTDDDINILIIKFPCAEAGLPEGCETIDSSISPDLIPKFFKAVNLLQEPLEELLQQHHPDCVVADMFFPWATDSAAKFGIPRLVFHGISFFSLCANACMNQYEPHKSVSSDSEQFVITNLPGEIKMTRMQLQHFLTNNDETDQHIARLFKEIADANVRSYGVIVNSFYELENVYADYYREVIGIRAWHIGPLSLCNNDTEEKTSRGKEASIDKNECLKWLDTKKPNSVVYVCFGSMTKFPDSQLRDIAMGLEASGQQFIWVLRKKSNQDEEEWLPEGFEKRIESKGLIIRGWAPQVLILGHEAIGAFVTHCGWNSTLEGVAAGVPMVTWPIGAEQFYNEKLVTDVLKIGVSVGAKKWGKIVAADSIKWEALEKAMKRIMEGDEAEGMRKRAKELSQMAVQAVEAGGSSDTSLNAFIHDLTSLHADGRVI